MNLSKARYIDNAGVVLPGRRAQASLDLNLRFILFAA